MRMKISRRNMQEKKEIAELILWTNNISVENKERTCNFKIII